MTTYTRIPDDEEEAPSISVDITRKLSAIDPMIYGGFMEHMGRCIYGGIYIPSSSRPSSSTALIDTHGYRTDVLSALRELNIPVMRYPGGNFVATYHWEDGVGPREKRPRRVELAWAGVESNEFGTDEFMHWLSILSSGREKRVEPYIALNMGTGTLDEALAWVEYCNGTKDTHYANLRRQNGHPEPYNVKYWALGNEVYGDWQVAQLTPTAYATMAAQWSKALLLLDPSLQLILCGLSGLSSWDMTVLPPCISRISMHSIHCYTSSPTHLLNVTSPLQAEHAIKSTASLISIARIEAGVSPEVPIPKICFDEWNIWDPARAIGSEGAEEKYTLSDALALSIFLNTFIRQSAHVGMANLAQSVNVISPLMTHESGIYKQTTWYPLLLFSRYMHGHTLGVHVRAPMYVGPTEPAWLQGILAAENGGGASYLDVSGCVDGDGVVTIAVVNIHESLDFKPQVKGAEGKQVTVYTVTGRDTKVTNTKEKEEVGIVESKWMGGGEGYVFGKHSLTMMRWDTKSKGRKVEIEIENE